MHSAGDHVARSRQMTIPPACGLVYGSSNSTSSEPNENPLSVEDRATTIHNRIGIVADKELMAPGDRPVEIVDGGKVRNELPA